MPTIPTESSVENLTAEIIIHPSGSFLYGSKRGHDSIVMFAIHQKTGRLTVLSQHHVGGGNYQIDQSSGKLKRTKYEIDVPKLVCIKFARK